MNQIFGFKRKPNLKLQKFFHLILKGYIFDYYIMNIQIIKHEKFSLLNIFEMKKFILL